ncbi:DNA binding protein [Gordonia phage Cafasso]|uniref:DNA binding protein n=1 Tax=Gordonia phage Cafasso TaxID=2851095 RepID=A0AAE7VCE8_9CAUD|nr:DNA binding protein [Gordonia phage Cafasso]
MVVRLSADCTCCRTKGVRRFIRHAENTRTAAVCPVCDLNEQPTPKDLDA